MRVARIEREDFLQNYWQYRAGEHVTVTAPTQNGKTTFLFQLLAATDTSFCRIPPVVMVAKPQDPVPAKWLEALEYREVSKWPPRKKLFQEPPPGYALWPHHLKNVPPEVNNAHLASVFTPAYTDLFWKGNTIAVVDETYFHSAILGLGPLMTKHWTQGAGMGSALWDATQKPSGTSEGHIPTFRYNSSEHTFLGFDPDKRNRDRYAEIGGVDPKVLSDAVMGLDRFEWLYIQRTGSRMAVIGK